MTSKADLRGVIPSAFSIAAGSYTFPPLITVVILSMSRMFCAGRDHENHVGQFSRSNDAAVFVNTHYQSRRQCCHTQHFSRRYPRAGIKFELMMEVVSRQRIGPGNNRYTRVVNCLE